MKRLIFVTVFLLLSSFCFGQIINDTQLFNSDHWIYDSMYKLGKEQKVLGFYENSMLSAGELKFYLKQIDYESLSPSGKTTYDQVYNLLYSDSNLIPKLKPVFEDQAFKFYINLIANPEVYYKSNEDIPWSFRYCLFDNFLTSPMLFGFSNFVTIETDPFFGKSNNGAIKADNITNMPYRDGDLEFMFIRFSYGSTGLYFDNWGINFNISKQGYTIGNTKLGSIFYNKTFETDAFAQLNIYSKSFKYTGNIVQVDYTKYLFLHELEFILFKNLKFAIMEGSQLCNPAELRFTVPFMFMHQYSAWTEYSRSSDETPYGEEKFCAYFGMLLEWTPVKNTRLYLIYAQNEIQIPSERHGIGDLYPDSLGLQFGADVSVPFGNNAYLNFELEGIYASPYLYIKHTPLASLYRDRHDNLSSDRIKSWVGSPYGPDMIGGHLGFAYESIGKWKAGIAYNLLAKGENDFDMFKEMVKLDKQSSGGNPNNYDDGEYYGYYPPTSYRLGRDYDEARDDALNMLPTGIIQYTNQIILNGEYRLNKHLKFNAQALYSIIQNFGHTENALEHGIECSLSMTYNLF